MNRALPSALTNKPKALPPLPTISVTLRRPLMDIVNAQFTLDLTRDEILVAIEEGDLLYAFDLRRRSAKCPFIRIWNRSVFDYLTGKRTVPDSDNVVIESIIPPGINPNIAALAKIFSSDVDHCATLGRDKLITVTKAGRQGPGGGAIFDGKSIASFLLERRIL